MASDKLLREFISEVVLLTEEGEGGGEYADLSMADATGSPYGMSFGSNDDLYNTFVKPFTDVVGVAAGKTKALSQKGQTLVRVAFEAVATTLVPILRDSYGEIFEKEKEELDKIRRDYHDVFQATWDAFEDHDALLAAFLHAPASFITSRLAKQSPKVVIKMISVLTGGTLDTWLDKVKNAFGVEGGPSGANKPVHGGDSGPMESTLHEDGGNHPPIEQVLTSDKVRARVADAPVTKKLQQRGTEITRGTLEKVYKQAKGVLGAKSLEQLQQLVHRPLKGLDKMKGVPQQERQAAEQQILAAAKKSMREFYTKNLEGQVKQALDQGVPDDSPYISDYRRVISKIKAL